MRLAVCSHLDDISSSFPFGFIVGVLRTEYGCTAYVVDSHSVRSTPILRTKYAGKRIYLPGFKTSKW
jgi:hypothetical protein